MRLGLSLSKAGQRSIAPQSIMARLVTAASALRAALTEAEQRYHFRVSITGDETLIPPNMRLERVRVLTPEERELRVELQPLVANGALLVERHEGWLTTRADFERGALVIQADDLVSHDVPNLCMAEK